MGIIVALAGLILATSSYVQEKGKRSRAEAEIAAMSAALESYKADNRIYPTNATETETIDPTAFPVDPKGSKFLYAQLSGDADFDGAPDGKSYMPFKPQNLLGHNPAQPIGPGNLVDAIRDPFGDAYGYSTAKAAAPAGSVGFNPTFDLWSSAGTNGNSVTEQQKWIKNW